MKRFPGQLVGVSAQYQRLVEEYRRSLAEAQKVLYEIHLREMRGWDADARAKARAKRTVLRSRRQLFELGAR